MAERSTRRAGETCSSMASRGFAIGTWYFILFLVIMAFFLVGPIILAEAFPVLKIMLLAFFCYEIYKFVEARVGGGVLTYVLSGILIYVFVIVLWPLLVASYFFTVIVGLGLFGPILFQLQHAVEGK